MTTGTGTPSLRVALRRREDAEKLVRIALEWNHEVGSSICWERNGLHFGEVIQHSGHDRIKVRNRNTGKELWIYATSIRE